MLEWLMTALHLRELNLLAVVDIGLLAYFIYRLLLLIRGTRAAQAMTGMFLLVLAHFITGPGLIDLRTIHTALGYLLLYVPFAIIVLFQNPIRQALARFGWNPVASLLPTRTPHRMIDEVVLAAASLASKRTGALIVLERRMGLRAFADTGIRLDARVTYDLLMNLFTPGSPLHDGAVIIADGRIRAASCYLPLTTDPDLSRTYGTRHRAAVGITEETDALAVVASEERGIVSLAEDGRIVEHLSAQELGARLKVALGTAEEDTGPEAPASAPVADSTHA